MKDLVLGVEPADDTDDTYAPIREVAEGAKKIDDIVVQDEIIASALFLAHFHAMQAVYKEEPDDWSEQTAANADWQSSITKKVPSDLVRQAIFGSKLDG